VSSLQSPLYRPAPFAGDLGPSARQNGILSAGNRPLTPDASSGLHRAFLLLTGHLVVALVALVVIGGTTRVMEAGLACPDWPLCYGVLLPGRQMNVQVFLEWFHRLDAFLVGLALLALSGLSLAYRSRLPGWLPWLSAAALALVAVQGLLGALTVIHLLEASTVTAHLGTALVLVLLVSALHQRLVVAFAVPALATKALGTEPPGKEAIAEPLTVGPTWWRLLLSLSVLLVLGQCLVGGAMASQWSAKLCFAAGQACSWLLAHRLGAYPAALSVLMLGLASLALPASARAWRGFALAASGLVLLQLLLGVFTLRLALAVPAITISHQFTAALLVALLGALLGRTWPGSTLSVPSILKVDHG